MRGLGFLSEIQIAPVIEIEAILISALQSHFFFILIGSINRNVSVIKQNYYIRDVLWICFESHEPLEKKENAYQARMESVVLKLPAFEHGSDAA